MHAAPQFAFLVQGYLRLGVLLLAMVLLAWALIHVLVQRPDKFAALGGFQKQHWLLLLAGLFVGTPLFTVLGLTVIQYIGIGAAAYYLLETRRGLKDVSEGHW